MISSKHIGHRRNGLILLVVLGMLSLLSLLAVSYVVFSGQSRNASVALIKREFRRTPPDKLLDMAFRQVVRGTTDPHSVAWKNDIYGDLYGSEVTPPSGAVSDFYNDVPLFLRARYVDGTVLRDNPQRVANEPYAMPSTMGSFVPGSPEAPQVFPTGVATPQFLKIPIAWTTGRYSIKDFPLPEQWDAWNGRIITFVDGPLINKSLRIVRYVGEVNVVTDSSGGQTLDPERAALQYSITVDLSELTEETVSVRNAATGSVRTGLVSEWLATSPATLLYRNAASLVDPYVFMVNPGVMNSNGIGLDLSRNPAPDLATTTYGTLDGQVADAFLPNRAMSKLFNSNYSPVGDTDEPWDAADAQNFYLAHKQQPFNGSTGSDDIIPSFHRPAIINRLVALSPDLSTGFDPNDLPTRQRFFDFLELVQRATGRPVSYNLAGLPPSIATKNPDFSGSNGLSGAFGGGLRTPQLNIIWSSLPSATEDAKFQSWLRWMTRGPWDVDNDGDGVGDSIWTDLNMPLITSPDGKLLKALVAFYIEDMDGKLDLNAAGNSSQTPDASSGLALGSDKYAYNRVNGPGNPVHWPQGLGYGAAEISLRPLFTAPTSTEYELFLSSRYRSGATGDVGPGNPGNDTISAVLERNRPNAPGLFTAPPARAGFPFSPLPMAVQGKSGLGLDLLGNPLMVENGLFNETIDDAYESRMLFQSHADNHFSFSDYERLVRFNDVDRTGRSRRLQQLATTFSTTSTGYMDRIRSMSPRNVSLTLPTFPMNYTTPRYTGASGATDVGQRRVTSFVEFVEAYAKNKSTPLLAAASKFPNAAIKRLFPIEFMQNRPLDLNRPLGNGLDDDFDGVIDEADEPAVVSTYPTGSLPLPNDEYFREPLANVTPPVAIPSNLDPALEAAPPAIRNIFNGNQAKQLLARHLYCLAQLILPAEYKFPNHPSPSTVATAAERARIRARILAQWAVNVVDFRDQDSASTRFAYDSTPFAAKGGVYWVPGSSATDDGVVWGLEQPELLLTEALAFHNINVRKDPNSPPGGPQQYQQLRVPQGSVFLEFMVPRTTSNVSAGDATLPPATSSLYTFEGGIEKLDLNKTVFNPDDSDPRHQFPVWRVAFLKPTPDGTGHKDAFTKAYSDPEAKKRFSYSFQVGAEDAGLKWEAFEDSVGTKITMPEIDRVMWFAKDIDPASTNHGLPLITTNPEDHIFKWTAGNNRVAGGQYLVVGPRPITYMGSKKQTGVPDHKPSNHRFQLMNNWLQIWNQNNEPTLWAQGTPTPLVANNTPVNVTYNAVFNDRIRECVVMTAGMAVPTTWSADPQITEGWIGLNVSEPFRNAYYPKPDYYLNSDTAAPADTETNAPKFTDLSKDAYIDRFTNSGTPPRPSDCAANAYLRDNQFPGSTGSATAAASVTTQENWSAAVLQRLADPLRPFHPIFNPYITVDWMTLDLTVFSGEEEIDATPGTTIKYASRQKTGAIVLPTVPITSATAFGSTFYSYHTSQLPTAMSPLSSADAPYFDYEISTELYAAMGASAAPRGATANFSTLGFLNPTFVIRGTGSLQVPPVVGPHDYQFVNYFKGAPGPNPWARTPTDPLLLPRAPYFANRDFVNAFELTNVPLSSPGQFMQEFVLELAPSSPAFKHTLDFEDLLLPLPVPPNPPTVGQERATSILFDCVGVRSPWGDSWKVAHPAFTRGFVSPASTNDNEITQTHLFENYRAPFNQIPTFREPGRINLNTVSEPTVFRGLMWNIMTPTDITSRTSSVVPFQNTIVDSRRGYGQITVPMPPRMLSDPNPQLDPRAPTEFMKIFGSALTPLAFPLNDQKNYMSAGQTILRHYPTPAGARMFGVGEPGVFPGGNVGTDNSFTHNYPVQRMANLVTNKSNVFSVRMTLGFFEVNPGTLSLGQEYGAEQGRSKRHRAFYMIDRSVPVGYQAGYDHNIDDCILVRSMIE